MSSVCGTLRVSELETVKSPYMTHLLRTFRSQEGRYTVQLPFKKHHQQLLDNYELSLVRLNSLYRRLQREPALLKEYNSIIPDQIENNIIEKVDKIDIPQPGEVYFIPHQAVIRKQAASTHLRTVFDASSKVQPDLASLNDCLWTGPLLMPAIMNALIRFRAWKYGLVVVVIVKITRCEPYRSKTRVEPKTVVVMYYTLGHLCPRGVVHHYSHPSVPCDGTI